MGRTHASQGLQHCLNEAHVLLGTTAARGSSAPLLQYTVVGGQRAHAAVFRYFVAGGQRAHAAGFRYSVAGDQPAYAAVSRYSVAGVAIGRLAPRSGALG